MASQGRFVDTVAAPNKVDNIQVLSVGLSRTGTLSMFHALKKLGYNSYHMWKAGEEQPRTGHFTMWAEAMEAKYPQFSSSRSFLKPYSSSDFHKILQDYETTADIPSIHFVPELLAAYPKAKIILTTHPRGVEAWLRSVNTCLYQINSWSVWERVMFRFDADWSRPYITHLRRSMQLWTGLPWPEAGDFNASEARLRAFYAQHNDIVRRLAREQNRELLEFDPRQGWEPLCKFLGKKVPGDGGYPHINEGDHIVYVHYWIVYRRLRKKLIDDRIVLITVTLTALAVAGSAWLWEPGRRWLTHQLLLAWNR